ncbi:MAG: hypothetical protein LBC33_00290 [Mycoplasmataceae bacterium]|jgi:DNA-directed RNA polymerase delta subunit|nr:hypothetical protein [Mycoplasmataceae bacterium]
MPSYQILINEAYNAAKSKFGKNPFTFNELVNLVKSSPDFADISGKLGYLYNELLKDTRFLYVGNKNWVIKAFLTIPEINAYRNSLYDLKIDGNDVPADLNFNNSPADNDPNDEVSPE